MGSFAKNLPALEMNSLVAMISKALILVLYASLAPDVYATVFKCPFGQTETCQDGSSECIANTHPHKSLIVRLPNYTFYCNGGTPMCCAVIAGYNQCYAAQSA
ncbi:hypothetical protein H4Q26_016982 [Puccinia striiformis f. sp. tritici PST-130]|nr:hypothetical protein H4Q26_016982 [Puccinia striiformis f. sp. tritici PST-130]